MRTDLFCLCAWAVAIVCWLMWKFGADPWPTVSLYIAGVGGVYIGLQALIDAIKTDLILLFDTESEYLRSEIADLKGTVAELKRELDEVQERAQ